MTFIFNNQLGAPTYEVQLYNYLYRVWIQSPPGYWTIDQIAQATGKTVVEIIQIVHTWVNTDRAEWKNTIYTHFTFVKQWNMLGPLGALASLANKG